MELTLTVPSAMPVSVRTRLATEKEREKQRPSSDPRVPAERAASKASFTCLVRSNLRFHRSVAWHHSRQVISTELSPRFVTFTNGSGSGKMRSS